MAYALQPLTEEEERQQEQIRAASGIPAAGGGAPLPAGAQPSATSGASGNFTNLQRYLTENESQAGDLANKVGESVRTTGEEAKTAAEGLAATGKQQIESGRVQPTGIVDEAATNPTAVAADEAKKAAFQRERDAAYGGPAGLEEVEGFQDVQDKVRKAQERTGLTDTESGRTTLLQEMGGPGYGRGKAVLNQLLLSGNPDAAGIVQGAAEPYRNLQDFLGAQSDEARTAAQKAAEEAAATKKAVQDRFLGEGGVIPSFEQGVTARTGTALEEAKARLARQQRGMDLGFMLPEDMAGLGLGTPEDIRQATLYANFINSLYGETINPADYFTQTGAPENVINPANVASAEDYAQYAALADLMGIPASFLTDPTQAGTAGNDFADVDFRGLEGIMGRLGERDTEFLNRYGVTTGADGRLSIAGNIAAESDPAAVVERIKEIARRGVGKLPSGYDQFAGFDPATEEKIRRMLEGGMVITPNPIFPKGGV